MLSAAGRWFLWRRRLRARRQAVAKHEKVLPPSYPLRWMRAQDELLTPATGKCSSQRVNLNGVESEGERQGAVRLLARGEQAAELLGVLHGDVLPGEALRGDQA